MKRARIAELVLPHIEYLRRPIWRSIELAIAWQIDIGRLPAGYRLPSTRTLARQLGLSRNTVALAFDALVAAGYLASHVGDGTYVTAHVNRARPPLWRRHWRTVQDPDGLIVRITL